MQTETDAVQLARILAWYQAMGVDAALGETPIDWFERGDTPPGARFALPFALPSAAPAEAGPAGSASPPVPERSEPRAPLSRSASSPTEPPRAPAQIAPTAARRFEAIPPDQAELSARAAAQRATTLSELEAALRTFDACGLKATAKNLCFFRGAGNARLMIIGEAPGRDEDIEGRPFVGRAGQLLDKMLAAIGLTEADVHITNIVYWRPPGNRTPTPQEAQVCRPFLERQIELVAPEAMILLGGAAAKHVLDVADGIMRIRGKWREAEVGGRRIKAMATLHPAYLLRTPAAKRLAWRDLMAMHTLLAGSAPTKP